MYQVGIVFADGRVPPTIRIHNVDEIKPYMRMGSAYFSSK